MARSWSQIASDSQRLHGTLSTFHTPSLNLPARTVTV